MCSALAQLNEEKVLLNPELFIEKLNKELEESKFSCVLKSFKQLSKYTLQVTLRPSRESVLTGLYLFDAIVSKSALHDVEFFILEVTSSSQFSAFRALEDRYRNATRNKIVEEELKLLSDEYFNLKPGIGGFSLSMNLKVKGDAAALVAFTIQTNDNDIESFHEFKKRWIDVKKGAACKQSKLNKAFRKKGRYYADAIRTSHTVHVESFNEFERIIDAADQSIEECKSVRYLTKKAKVSSNIAYRVVGDLWEIILTINQRNMVIFQIDLPVVLGNETVIRHLAEKLSAGLPINDIKFVNSNNFKGLMTKDRIPCEPSLSSLELEARSYVDRQLDAVNKNLKYQEGLRIFEDIVAEKPYHEFMYRAYEPRKVTCYIGPTNSGKSYHARVAQIERIKEAHQLSAALFPLRALALENQIWFNNQRIPTSLITGEERDIVHHHDLICQTIETYNLEAHYDVLLIDEAQLAFSSDRGPAYLKAMAASKCNSLVMTASPESKIQLTDLFALFGEEVEFIELDRLCPLEPLKAPIGINEIQHGDLVVSFSIKKIHDLARAISKMGHRVGTIYGSMSPPARRNMMDSYHRGEIDVMVSTDAIGMGCNCPVDRVLFAETSKFDGKSHRPLTEQEFKQIAGRAGRFGHKEMGYYGTLQFFGRSSRKENHIDMIENVTRKQHEKPLKALYALPDKEAFMASPFTLQETLEAWVKATCSNHLYEQDKVRLDELKDKAKFLQDRVDEGGITRELGINLFFVAFNYEKHGEFFEKAIYDIEHEKSIELNGTIEPTLMEMEDRAERLAIFAQLQRLVPDLCPTEEDIAHEQEVMGHMIYKKLIRMYGTHKKNNKKRR